MAWQIPVHPQHGAPIEIARRRSYTPAQRREIWQQRGGVCLHCGGPVAWKSSWHVCHPEEAGRAMGGSDRIEDLWPGHADCNLRHWREVEAGRLAKAKRVESHHHTGRGRARKGPKMPTRKMPSAKDLGLRFNWRARRNERI